MQPEEANAKSFMKSNYSDNKLDKSSELNGTMSVSNSSPDELETNLHNLTL